MEDTGFFVEADKAERLATLYQVTEDSGLNRSSQGRPFDPPSAPSGAGGLLSTASDYLRFAQMLLNGGELDGARILGKKTVELMTMDHLPSGVTLPEIFYNTYRLGGYGFGLGVRVRTDVAQSQILGSPGEYGWAGAFETYFLVDPEEELVAMFLMQLAPSGFYPLRRVFNNLVYQAIVN
jgi:CubicO group peptidase (beta-lactamase class C family)